MFDYREAALSVARFRAFDTLKSGEDLLLTIAKSRGR